LQFLVGLYVGDTTLGTTVANLGFEKTEFPKPVFHGDTLYADTEAVEKRESRYSRISEPLTSTLFSPP
jgi:acyl dehydratase